MKILTKSVNYWYTKGVNLVHSSRVSDISCFV